MDERKRTNAPKVVGTIPRLIKEGPGRYRVGDFTITEERRSKWRVTWDPIRDRYRTRSGVMMDAFLTLRSARIHVEQEIEAERQGSAKT